MNTMKNKFFKHSYLGSSMNKKGLEMAINTIVILVLSISVLAFMLLFFTDAGGNFLEKIRGYQGYSNVDSLISNCNFYVETDSSYSYCCEEKNVKYLQDGEKTEGEFTCLEISDRFGNVEGMNCGGVTC